MKKRKQVVKRVGLPGRKIAVDLRPKQVKNIMFREAATRESFL